VRRRRVVTYKSVAMKNREKVPLLMNACLQLLRPEMEKRGMETLMKRRENENLRDGKFGELQMKKIVAEVAKLKKIVAGEAKQKKIVAQGAKTKKKKKTTRKMMMTKKMPKTKKKMKTTRDEM